MQHLIIIGACFLMQMFTIYGFHSKTVTMLNFSCVLALDSICHKCEDVNLIFFLANVTINYEKAKKLL